MLSRPRPDDRPPQRRLSLRQEYEEFMLQRIEDYKDQLSRTELLAIADEAVRELEVGPEEQLVLTEVLVLEHVDRLIMRRLKLPTFRRWRQRHVRLRRAQREPTHWGIPPETPLIDLIYRLEPADLVLVVGSAAAPTAYFIAAHDVEVLVIDDDLPGIEGVESRAAAEGLGSRVSAMVVSLGTWFPDITPALVVLDSSALSALDAAARLELARTLQEQTVRGGVHLILAGDPTPDIHALAPEALQSQYRRWTVDRGPKRGKARWMLATKP